MSDAQKDPMKTGESASSRATGGAPDWSLGLADVAGSTLPARALAGNPSPTDKPTPWIQRRSTIIGAMRVAAIDPCVDGGF